MAAESLRVWGQLARFVTSQRGGEQQITNGKKRSRHKIEEKKSKTNHLEHIM